MLGLHPSLRANPDEDLHLADWAPSRAHGSRSAHPNLRRCRRCKSQAFSPARSAHPAPSALPFQWNRTPAQARYPWIDRMFVPSCLRANSRWASGASVSGASRWIRRG